MENVRHAVLEDAHAVSCRVADSSLQAQQRENGAKARFPNVISEALVKAGDSVENRANKDQEMERWINAHRATVLPAPLTLDGIDPALDTPIEILHTFLLGIVQYAWLDTHQEIANTPRNVD